ncbi:hypothetical protein GEV33_008809 [Tenebrio molitor]|uniref:Uncharacterized protein n=1 Tax=Tenebrio molitor TaxID=7067 RepID=A0A8J6LB92_TENMO|nr:hypothetical protein GEV33_008809 [Tenebrio molitor]
MKNRVKTTANTLKREARKTGGGENEAIPLTAIEEKMLSFIGIESIEGISGGIDSFRQTVMNNPASSESPDLQLPVPQPVEIISIPGPSSSNPDTFRDAVMNTSVELLHVASEFDSPPKTISISGQPSANPDTFCEVVMPLLDLQAIWGCHNSQTLAPRKSLQKKKKEERMYSWSK